MVRRPSVFLLDEPLAHMDALNRHMMRAEIRLLQRGYGVTMLYATNDQEEAMVLADRIAVIDEGLLQQVAPPQKIYREPANMFVAGFVGSPAMSFLDGEATNHGIRLKAGELPWLAHTLSGPVVVGVRPHHWEMGSAAGLRGVVTTFESHGDHGFAAVDLCGDQVTLRTKGENVAPGDRVELWTRHFHVFDRSGRALAHIN